MLKILMSCALLTGILIGWGPSAKALEAEVFKINYLWVEEALSVVAPHLSPQGKATADHRTNALVVFDTRQRIQHLRAVLKQVDQPPSQVRIEVRFDEEQFKKRRSARRLMVAFKLPKACDMPTVPSPWDFDRL
jgi:hypothetical protein